jgi:hypothetical protein
LHRYAEVAAEDAGNGAEAAVAAMTEKEKELVGVKRELAEARANAANGAEQAAAAASAAATAATAAAAAATAVESHG